ncbi:TPA: DNA polymerase III subunit delta' [Neisseria meningitidis]
MIYPWHNEQWRQIAEHWERRPNAWLFAGKKDTGKTTFARFAAKALLCETPAPGCKPCGECMSCHLFGQGSHPDFYEITPLSDEPENGRKLLQIKIDAVRKIIDNVYLTSVRGGLRVILIHPAESMNVQAANSLLKVLEEPPPQVVFLLVSHAADKVLPTIKSRCRKMVLPAPSHEEALAYLRERGVAEPEERLAFHSGAPLFDEADGVRALRIKLLDILAEPRLLKILDYAALFDKEKLPLAVFVGWMQKWLVDLGLCLQHMKPVYYPAYEDRLLQTASGFRPRNVFAAEDMLKQLAPYGFHTLNVKMQIEHLLINYLELKKENG